MDRTEANPVEGKTIPEIQGTRFASRLWAPLPRRLRVRWVIEGILASVALGLVSGATWVLLLSLGALLVGCLLAVRFAMALLLTTLGFSAIWGICAGDALAGTAAPDAALIPGVAVMSALSLLAHIYMLVPQPQPRPLDYLTNTSTVPAVARIAPPVRACQRRGPPHLTITSGSLAELRYLCPADPPTFSCNSKRDVWPFSHWGLTPDNHRVLVQGQSSLLDAIVVEVLRVRSMGGRFRVTQAGVTLADTDETVMLFQLSPGFDLQSIQNGLSLRDP